MMKAGGNHPMLSGNKRHPVPNVERAAGGGERRGRRSGTSSIHRRAPHGTPRNRQSLEHQVRPRPGAGR